MLIIFLKASLVNLPVASVNDPLGRQFSTDYQYYAFRVQLQLGEVIDYSQSSFANAIKNLYVGAGIGIIYGKITSINRYSDTSIQAIILQAKTKATRHFYR